MKTSLRSLYRKLSPFQLITFSFSAIILLGSLLLYLPAAQTGTEKVTFLNTLFTSCSAVCVTGLVTYNTATCWSFFGKCVILCLIQIGGLGVVTIIIAGALITGKRIGLRQRSLIQNALNAPKIGGIIRFTRFLLLFTLFFEGVGACLLLTVFIREYPIGEAMFKAVFHSISAFCNAGFDLLGSTVPFSSLTAYHNHLFLNAVIMLLIIAGGLGFLSWSDLLQSRFRWRKLTVQTKLILISTLLLISVPAAIFFFTDFSGEALHVRLLLSVFQSVTTRTAGFNTAEIGHMKDGNIFLMIILMLIGASPGSTAGGIKTTTVSLISLSCIRNISRHKHVSAFGRSFSPQIIQQAFSLLMLYLGLLIAGTYVISVYEHLPVTDCMFECASALGTVGLTTGITPTLGPLSRIILICFMYFGRVGGLTLAYAALSDASPEIGKLPEEQIMIG